MRFVCLAPFVCLSLFVCFGHSACLRCFIVVMRFACVVHCVGRFVFAHRCRRFPLSHAVRLLLCGPPGLCISCVSSVFVRSVCFPSSVSQIIWFVKFSTRYTYFIENISRTSAVSSTNIRSIFIFASCVVGTCNILFSKPFLPLSCIYA